MENSIKITQFKNLMNDPSIPQQEKSAQLSIYLKELIDLKLSLQITAKERYLCMICSKLFISNDDKFPLDSCECLQIVHKACLKQKSQENFFEVLSCYSCKKPISEPIMKKFSKSIVENSNPQKPLNISLFNSLPTKDINHELMESHQQNQHNLVENQKKIFDKPKKPFISSDCKIF